MFIASTRFSRRTLEASSHSITRLHMARSKSAMIPVFSAKAMTLPGERLISLSNRASTSKWCTAPSSSETTGWNAI